jgi:hypothetical protein
VEAPVAGQFYYRAFLPRAEWRDREKRLGRPWELHISEKGGEGKKVAGQLILPADRIDDNGGQGDLKFEVKSAEEMARTLAEKSDKFSQTVYVFAPEGMRYGDLLGFVREGMKTHDTMYVFVEK